MTTDTNTNDLTDQARQAVHTVSEFGIDVDVDQPDPYMGPCPAWCSSGERGRHFVVSHDDDRQHFSDLNVVQIRGLRAEYVPAAASQAAFYSLGHTEIYLRQHDRARDPRVHVNLNGSNVSVDLTLDEAANIGAVLLALVEAAR